jgi:hypothetical protein
MLLFGEWGCGKTWYINRVLIPAIRLLDVMKDRHVVYVSLNGKKSSESIMMDVAQQVFAAHVNPLSWWNPKRWLVALRPTVRPALDRIDHWTADAASVLMDNFSLYGAEAYIRSRRPVIVLDDFERLQDHVTEHEILGVINHLSEHMQLHVIVIANIVEAEKRMENLSILLEKVFGWRFEIRSDVRSFIAHEIETVRIRKTKAFLLQRMTEIRGIFDKMEAINLRSIKMAFRHFATIDAVLVQELPEKDLAKFSEGRMQVLRRIFAGTLMTRMGKITCAEVLELIAHRMLFWADANDPEKQAKKEQSKKLIETYLDDKVTFTDDQFRFIAQLIDAGRLDRDGILKMCRHCIGADRSPEIKDIESLTTDNFLRLTDEGYRATVARCFEHLTLGHIRDPESFRTLGRNLIYHARRDLIGKTVSEIIEMINEAARNTAFLYDREKVDQWLSSPGPVWDEDDRQMVSAITNRIREQDTADGLAEANQWIAQGIIPFITWACDMNARRYRTAVFAYTKPNEFWSGFFQLPNNERSDASAMLRSRLAHVTHTGRLPEEEMEWIRNSLEYLKGIPDSSQSPVSRVHKDHIINDLMKALPEEGTPRR